MQVEELYDLTTWIDNEIVDAEIVQKYQQLHNVLRQNAQPDQPKQPFADQKEVLIKALGDVALAQLSIGQIDVLSTIGIAPNVGPEGVAALEDALFRNAIDIATAAQRVQNSIQKINEGVQWSQQVRDLLSKIITSDEIAEIGDSVLLRVHFSGDAHLSNLTEFKHWGKVWWEIGRGIAMAHNDAPENIRVIGATKGSIIISLLTAYGIAKTTSAIIMEALKLAEKVLEIRKKAEEVKALKLANGKLEKLLEEEADKAKKAGVDKIVNDKIKDLKLNAKEEGDKINALGDAIRKLVDFVEKGGEVDFVLPDEEEAGDEATSDQNREARDDLRVMFRELRQLENKVHQLEHKDR